MNAENFAEIIRNPSQLHQFSFQELKSLVLQYPYSQNLQLLLLVKSLQDRHKDFDKILARTSALSTDRRHLYHLLKSMEQALEAEESFELGEDFLELKELSSLEVEAADLPAVAEPESQAALPITGEVPDWDSAFPTTPDLSADEDPGEEEITLVVPPGTTPAPPEETGRQEAVAVPDKLVKDLIALTRLLAPAAPPPVSVPSPVSEKLMVTLVAWGGLRPLLKNIPAKTLPPEPGPRPKPKTAFRSWPGMAKPPGISFLREEPPKPPQKDDDGKKTKKKKKQDAIIAFAERSLQEHEEIATETLADLLVQQERYDKAIQMYERLILIFPEKSSFFAEKIEALKKLS